MSDMVTTNDVMDLMGCLTVSDRLIVVEETLRDIRDIIPESESNNRNELTIKTSPNLWYEGFVGSISDEAADEMMQAIEEGNKIDHDGWNVSL